MLLSLLQYFLLFVFGVKYLLTGIKNSQLTAVLAHDGVSFLLESCVQHTETLHVWKHDLKSPPLYLSHFFR